MTALVLPDIDRSTLAELRERMPSLKLSEIDPPSLDRAGRDANRAVERLLGRSGPTLWPWFVLGLAVLALASVTLWFRASSRQRAWAERQDPADAPPTSETAAEGEPYGMEGGRP